MTIRSPVNARWFGIRDFFSLSPTAGAALFTAVLLVSTVLYRPFCRVVCPSGAVLRPAAAPSRLGLQRTEACIGWRRCERACPVDEAKREDAKAQCYLCGRCTEVRPVEGTRVYGRRHAYPGDETR